MSQHDMNIANQGFPAFRADLNNALAALASTSAADTEPSTTFANQLWMDTDNNILKVRNEDDDAWINLATFDQTTDSVTYIDSVELAKVIVSDAVQTFTAAQRGAVATLTEAATIAVDLALSNNFTVTLTGTATAVGAPTNAVAGQSGSIFIVQDAGGGNILSWNTAWKWAGGTAPTLSTAGDAVDRVDYIVKGASEIQAVWTGGYAG
jgi:hypothetical protein